MTRITAVSKKTLALLMALLMMFSCMAVSASATDTPNVPNPDYVLNEGEQKITITPPTVEGYEVGISITPRPSDPINSNGKIIYINLVPGTTYTLKAYIAVGEELKYSTGVQVPLKEKQTTPAAPVPVAVTSTSIKIAAVNGCEYRLNDGEWGSDVVFEGLEIDTQYVVSIRKKATGTKYASDAAKITVKTLKPADKVAAATPVLVDKTNTTITVKEVAGVQFSIDKGKTWQSSGEFTALTPDTIYGVIARKNFNPAVQDPNPVSGILEIRTNAKARFTASTGKCTFTLAEGKVYADEPIKVTVKADAPANLYDVQYGDTKLVPKHVLIDGESFELKPSGSVYSGYITPGAGNANSTITVKVVYNIEKYDGEFWDPAGSAETTHKIEVGPKNDIFTKLSEFFTEVANALLNTIPQFFADMMESDIWDKLFAGIFDLIGNLEM